MKTKISKEFLDKLRKISKERNEADGWKPKKKKK